MSEARDEANRPRVAWGGHRGALVLCVDDDATSRHVTKELIERAGHGFLGVGSGAECLALLQRTNPRIILLDIIMPEMDGYETCRRIRLHFPLLRARIIYLTALGSPEDVTRALGTDADDYLVKPYRPERLRERIQHWLREGPRELEP
ncbi:MAG: response regulator [Alphaproteobacteria bacterium]